MNRADHLEWCKQRARNYLDRGQISAALTSLLSDLNKHEELAAVPLSLGPLALDLIAHQDKDGARRLIDGIK